MDKNIKNKMESYHHGDLKNALISTGVKIIFDEGIDKLSIRYAAKKLGVSHTAPYRHFKDKEELVVAIAVKGFDILEKELDDAIAKHPDNYLSQFTEAAGAYINFAKNNHEYYKIMFGNYIMNKTDYPQFFKAYDSSFKKMLIIVVGIMGSKGKKKDEIAVTTIAAWSLVHGYSSLIIDNQMDKLVGSDGQVKALLRKMKDLLK